VLDIQWPLHGDEHDQGSVDRPVGEAEPLLLGNFARVEGPLPKLDVVCVCRLDEVGDDVLQGTSVVDHTSTMSGVHSWDVILSRQSLTL
jgi:hypothetical protein